MTSTWRSRAELAHQVTLLAKQASRGADRSRRRVSRNTVRTLLAAARTGPRHRARRDHATPDARAARAKVDAWRSRIAS